MQIAFLPVPDKFVGEPMPLDEAVSWAAHGAPSRDTVIRWNDTGDFEIDPASLAAPVLEAFRPALASFVDALQRGALRSFIQAPMSGAWLAVPRFYWNRYIGAGANVPLLDGCEGVANAAGWDDSMKGAPLVVWRSDGMAWASAYRDQVEQAKVEPVAVRTGLAGRTSTVQHAKAIMLERAGRGETLDKLAHEAAEINRLLRSDARYSTVPEATDKALCNGLRDTFNGLKKA